jgi:D-alanyl-D-alanine carboxypeptidase
MMSKIAQKRHAIFATYPIAVFVFFVFLLGVSIYVQRIYDDLLIQEKIHMQAVDEHEKAAYMRSLSESYRVSQSPQRIVYQPVKKPLFVDLTIENAHAGIILDADSQTILWEKNATEQRSIASITKLVTAMIVIDRIQDLDEIVVIPQEVMMIEGTKVGCPTSVICTGNRFEVGEKVRIRDLLYATLLPSANDAATVLAIHIAGSEDAFAGLMNARLKEIGITRSHFCRPSGLELDENEEMCYSTAYDIARVIAHLLEYDKYDVLWDIMRTKEHTFTSLDGMIEHELDNTNRLVGEMPQLVGAKTGFTPRAGYCLALVTEDETKQHQVISVVLDDYHRFTDVEMMSQWAFDNYMWQ